MTKHPVDLSESDQEVDWERPSPVPRPTPPDVIADAPVRPTDLEAATLQIQRLFDNFVNADPSERPADVETTRLQIKQLTEQLADLKHTLQTKTDEHEKSPTEMISKASRDLADPPPSVTKTRPLPTRRDIRKLLCTIGRAPDNAAIPDRVLGATEDDADGEFDLDGHRIPYWMTTAECLLILQHLHVGELYPVTHPSSFAEMTPDSYLGSWAAGAIHGVLHCSGRHYVVAFNNRVPAVQQCLKDLDISDNNSSAEAKFLRRRLGTSAVVPKNNDAGDCAPDAIRLIAAVARAHTDAAPATPPASRPTTPRESPIRKARTLPWSAPPQPLAIAHRAGSCNPPLVAPPKQTSWKQILAKPVDAALTPIGARQKSPEHLADFDRVSHFNAMASGSGNLTGWNFKVTVEEATVYHGEQKCGKGPKGFAWNSDAFGDHDTLAVSLWDLSPDAQAAFGTVGNLIWINSPYQSRKYAFAPPLDRTTHLTDQQGASLGLRYELQFSDLPTSGRQPGWVCVLAKTPQPTTWAPIQLTPLEAIPETFPGVIIFNFECVVTQLGNQEQKTEPRRLVTVMTESGNRIDVMFWCKYATTVRTNTVLRIHRAEASCTVRRSGMGNAPAPRVPRQINVWSNSCVEEIEDVGSD